MPFLEDDIVDAGLFLVDEFSFRGLSAGLTAIVEAVAAVVVAVAVVVEAVAVVVAAVREFPLAQVDSTGAADCIPTVDSETDKAETLGLRPRLALTGATGSMTSGTNSSGAGAGFFGFRPRLAGTLAAELFMAVAPLNWLKAGMWAGLLKTGGEAASGAFLGASFGIRSFTDGPWFQLDTIDSKLSSLKSKGLTERKISA